MKAVAGEQQHGPAFEPGETDNDGLAEILADLEERAPVDDRLDDRAHLVDLLAVARHRIHQCFVAALRIVGAAQGRRQLVHRGRQVRQEAPRAGEGLFLGVDGMIDRAGAGLDVGAAELLLREVLPQRLHHRRPRDEHRGLPGHDRIVAGGKPRGTEPCDRAEAECDHRHARQVLRREAIPARAADAARQVRRALGLDGLDRTAAAGAFDDADDGQTEIMRHLLRHQRLCGDRRIRRTTTDREIVADHDHGAAIDARAAEHAVRRRQFLKLAAGIVLTDAGDGTNLVEAAAINQLVDTLPNSQPALVMLSLDLVNAAHLPREGFAPGELVEFRLPVHSGPPN